MMMTRKPHVLTPDADLSFPEFVLLKASAGSGKTHALSLRFVQFLLSERISKVPGGSLADILAITFTKNAAREMKERILAWLKACHFADPEAAPQVLGILSVPGGRLPSLAGEAIDRILTDYSDFQVQTIDAFMASIFRASAVDLGHSPDFEILIETRDVVEYAFSRYLRGVRAGSESGRLFDDILTHLLVNQSGDSAFLWNPGPQIRDRLADIQDKLAAQDRDIVIEDLSGERAAVEKKIAAAVERMEAFVAEAGLERNSRSGYNKVILAAVREKRFPDIVKASLKTAPLKKPRKKSDEPAYEEAMKKWSRLEDLLRDFFSVTARGFHAPYLKAFRSFSGAMERIKRLRGTVFIGDINKQLAGYIDQGIVPDIYFRLGERISHFLIDEFQDTSPIQWANMIPLIENSLAQGGSLFVVGDTKQAIYGFRDADYRIMKDLEAGVSGFDSAAVDVRELPDNYRCHGKVLEFVKQVFLKEAAENGDHAPIAGLSGLTGFIQEAVEKNRKSGYVRYIRFERKKKTGKAGEETDAAETVPRREEGRSPVRDKGSASGEESPAPGDSGGGESPEKKRIQDLVFELRDRGYSWADIAVLTYKNESVARISSWLNEAGIPFIPHSSLDIRKRRVIGEILAFLQFLDSPPDDLAFSTFLMGTLFRKRLERDGIPAEPGFWGAFLFENRAAARRPLYIAFRKTFPDLWDRYFEPFFKTVGYYPLYDCVTRIYRGLGVFELYENKGSRRKGDDPADENEEAALVKLLEVIKNFEAGGRNDLRGFLEASADEDGSGAGWTIDVPTDIAAVKVMSIHKAKGLGFPVVILLLYGESSQAIDFIPVPGEDGVRIYKITAPMAEANPELAALYEKMRTREKVNRLNTLYVALTRAQAELHIIGVKGRDKYPFDLIDPAADHSLIRIPSMTDSGAEGIPPGIPDKKGKQEPVPPDSEKAPREGSAKDAAGGDGGVVEYASSAVPPPAVRQKAKTAEAPHAALHRFSGPFELPPNRSESLNRSGIRRGEIAHALLAGIEFVERGWGEAVDAAARRVRQPDTETGVWSEVGRAVARYFESSQAGELFEKRPGRRVLRETDFCDRTGRVFRMDRVVVDADAVTVVDFKTGADAGRTEADRAQIRTYKAVLEQAFPGRRVRGRILRIDEGTWEEAE